MTGNYQVIIGYYTSVLSIQNGIGFGYLVQIIKKVRNEIPTAISGYLHLINLVSETWIFTRTYHLPSLLFDYLVYMVMVAFFLYNT